MLSKKIISLLLAACSLLGFCFAQELNNASGDKTMLLQSDMSANDLKSLINKKISFCGHVHAGKQGPQVRLNNEIFFYLKPVGQDRNLEQRIYDRIDSFGDQKVLIIGLLRFHAKEPYYGPLVDGQVPVSLPGDYYYCAISSEEDVTLASK